MLRKYLVGVFFLIFLSQARGQVIYTMRPQVVTASRLSNSLVSQTREILVLDRKEIERLPVSTVSELLAYVGGVDIQRRGIDGIQADWSLRGCSFEQVLVMLDGVRINDPQTGHHNGDIPLPLSVIERIEILPGHGSSLYGPNGFGGVIHIITRAPVGNETRIELHGGSYGYIMGHIGQIFRIGHMNNRISIEKQKSDGYRADTDYDVTMGSYSTAVQWGRKEFDLFLGYSSKDFGANGFYAPYPSREKTVVYHSSVSAFWQPNPIIRIESKIYRKRHDDTFILDSLRPSWYHNEHQTIICGGEVQANYCFAKEREFAVGFETTEESIKSSRLGDHIRNQIAFFGELAFRVSSRMVLDAGLRMDRNGNWGAEWCPSVSSLFFITPILRWRTSVGRIFRIPTFTELYYDSPTDLGNPKLKPEAGWSLETGLSIGKTTPLLEMTFFQRDEENRIDWIRTTANAPWQVTNIGEQKIRGISLSGQWAINEWIQIRGNYTSLREQNGKSKTYFSKYAFPLLKHYLMIEGFMIWPGKIFQSTIMTFKQKHPSRTYGILDLKWSREFKKMTIFLECTNILNTQYEEIPSVPMPGRRIVVGDMFLL